MMRGTDWRVRLVRLAGTLAAALVATTCTSSDDCAAGNPLMPVCVDPNPTEPRLLFLRSPDATWLRADIYAMNADGTNVRALTTHGRAWSAVWSPDGQRIAFQSNRHELPNACCETSIYVMNADGTNVQRLTTNSDDAYPRWSPHGKTISFASIRSGGAWHVFVMNPDGSNVRQLTTLKSNGKSVWSPDGTQLAFEVWRPATGGVWTTASTS